MGYGIQEKYNIGLGLHVQYVMVLYTHSLDKSNRTLTPYVQR